MREAPKVLVGVPKRPDLHGFALAALASIAANGAEDSVEMAFLRSHVAMMPDGKQWPQALSRYLDQPARVDLPLVALASNIGLSSVELLTVALAAAVETDLMAGRAIARLQTPLGGSRPTLGLVSASFSPLCCVQRPALEAVLTGSGLQSGLLSLLNEGAPLVERPIAVPPPLCLALRGHDSAWPGATLGLGGLPALELPSSVLQQAEREALALTTGTARVLVVRSASPSEARSIAGAIAQKLDRRALFVERVASISGLGPWLMTRKLLPVMCIELGPGERKLLPAIPFYKGPIIVLCGKEGGVEFSGEPSCSWTVDVPASHDRETLWSAALGDNRLAKDLARNHRHGAGRIAQIGRLARHRAILSERADIELSDVVEASRVGDVSSLETLAQPLTDSVPEHSLITASTLRDELERLYLRCLFRERLTDDLGISAVTRYRPGVRALLSGPSGTGKTLAAGWLATRLGLPLYRVDLASVTSKYIGETEKNLAQLLSRAEHAEVVLLFDEADSLFGRRTEIRESNDRFANAQTNYLLQRMETFDGIAILTANSRARFDAAFSRRLDAVIEFALPGPEQRRELWQSHLGERHQLSPGQLNQLAVLADISGGNIRNAVLTAALLARSQNQVIKFKDVRVGLIDEYRKLGRQLPADLAENF